MDRPRETTYITASQKIHNKPCKLYHLVVTPNGTNNSYADIYDGDNANEDIKMRVRVVSTTSLPLSFPDGLKFNKGLYVSFETNLYSVMIESAVTKD